MAISDAIDGLIARECDLGSEFGKSFDPLTDKIAYCIILSYFWYLYGYFSPWFFGLFLLVDFFGQFSRPLLVYINKETKANIYGKIKTSLMFILLFFCFIALQTDLFIIKKFLSFGQWGVLICAFFSVYFKFFPQK